MTTAKAAAQIKETHVSGKSKVKVYGWSVQDKSGIPYLLQKGNLRIDKDYQRTLSESRVLALVGSWSWLACGALLVAERSPGEFFVFDGQHRLEAANRRDDIDEMPCVVFKLSDIPAEALAFYRANCNRGNVTVFDKVHALLRAGDRVTEDALELMRSQNYEPAPRGGDYGVRCLGAFLRYFKTDRDLFTRAWPIIARLHDGRPIMDRPLAAVMYLAKHGEPSITTDEAAARLLEVGYDKIMGSINRISAAFERGGAKVYAQALIECLNKGRRAHKFALRDESEE
jgi:hypothetical protein